MPSNPAAVVRLRKVEHRLEQIFVREYLRVVNKVLKAHDVPSITAAINRPDDLSSIVALWRERVDKVVIPQVLSVYRDAAKNVLARYPELAQLLPDDYLTTLRNVRADAYVAERVNYIRNVGEDMFKAASEQVQQSLEAGEGAEKLADRVRETLGTGVSRSRTIARTEAGTAVNSADFTVARDAGVKTKTWLATDDERTRETHAEADGQTVPIDEPFTIGDTELMHPSDPDGDPAETINCRCTMTFGFGTEGMTAPLLGDGAFPGFERIDPEPLTEAAKVANSKVAEAAFRNNCHFVAPTMEMRARGLDAKAAQTYNNFGRATDSIEKDWIDPLTGRNRRFQPVWKDGPRFNYKMSHVEQATAEWPNNSRGFVISVWKNNAGSHIYNIFKDENGEIHLVDGQVQKRDAKAYLARTSRLQVMRVDDLEPVQERLRSMMTAKQTKVGPREQLAAARTLLSLYEEDVKSSSTYDRYYSQKIRELRIIAQRLAAAR